MPENKFIHDLQAVSGFGDRILDLWAVQTIAILKNPDARTSLKWDKGPTRNPNDRILGEIFEEAMKRDYANDYFQIDNVEFVASLPDGAVPMLRSIKQNVVNEKGIEYLAGGKEQIILISGPFPGSTSPETIKHQLKRYDLDTGISFEAIKQAYQKVAGSTKMSADIAAALPSDVEDRVGIHIRLTDKLVKNQVPWEMTPREWLLIERQCLTAIRQYIRNGVPMLICSDNPKYRDALVAWIRKRGGDAITIVEPPEITKKDGYAALADFYALSRTRHVVQMTKYSTFSMAAALMGNVPLVNFELRNSRSKNRVKIWQSAFVEYRFSQDEIGIVKTYANTALTWILYTIGMRKSRIPG